MPLRLLFALLAALALLGCAARPAVCKLPPQAAELSVESPMDVRLDVDMTSVVVESETEVVVTHIVVPAWSSCSRSIPSTVALAGHHESGP
jgi:hypothetical protein